MTDFGNKSLSNSLSVISVALLFFFFDLGIMKKSTDKESQMNVMKLIELFGTDEKCRARLSQLRWPHGVTCPRCESQSISTLTERDQYDCNGCRYRFSITSGTIFHD